MFNGASGASSVVGFVVGDGAGAIILAGKPSGGVTVVMVGGKMSKRIFLKDDRMLNHSKHDCMRHPNREAID